MAEHSFQFGDDLDRYLAEAESKHTEITKDTNKQIIWTQKNGEKSDLAIVYLHGFSATNYEIRPVPQKLAKALNANLFLNRLTGHGLDGQALARVTADEMITDLQEAIAIGQEIGKKTILLCTSTGGTLAAIAAQDHRLAQNIAGIIFVSPNFKINHWLAPLITFPTSRYWLPLIGGKEQGWDSPNPVQQKYWTTRFPSEAVFSLGKLVQKARKANYSRTNIPALFYFADYDKVVASKATERIASQWGGEVEIYKPILDEKDDPLRHLITGDINSPNQTDLSVDIMRDWVERNIK